MRTLVVGLVLLPGIAAAHIHLTFPKPRTDSQTGDQKTRHCGTINWVRADHADRNSTFAPGSTITVTWLETINHPGYYRISFQPNGEDYRIPPVVGNGGFPDENLTGMTDGPTGSLILADRIPDGTLSQEITFPNMECTNCTLQLIQVMTDKPPYTTDANSNDIYFKCADITLSASAPDAGPQPSVDAGVGTDAGNNNNNGSSVDGGGCSTGAGAGLAVAAMLVGVRRRRR